MMSVKTEVLTHLVRRGLNEYDRHGSKEPVVDIQISQWGTISLVVLALTTMFVLFSLSYTMGDLMARLAMIESSTATTIIESRPPPYSDEPDAPLEKKPLVEETDIEVVTIKHKPITYSVKATIMHLHKVGGFRGRWRGFRQAMVYGILVNVVSNILAHVLFRTSIPPVNKLLGINIATMLFCRFRMVWTHAMIAAPSEKKWYKRYCSRKNARVLLLPTLAANLAFWAEIIVPLTMWYSLGAFEYIDPSVNGELHSRLDFAKLAAIVLSAPISFALIAFFITIPVNASLARVEACLLPEEDQTIVPFDKDSIMGELDITVKGAPGKLFKAAWKSVTFSTSWRVLSIYMKMVFSQFVIILFSAIVGCGILYMSGGEELFKMAAVMIM